MRRFLAFMTFMAAIATAAAQQAFRADTLSDEVFARMQGRSFGQGCAVARSDLRLLTLLHRDAAGHVHSGQMVCNKAIAQDLIDIFRQLYEAGYAIERIQLIDDFDADDEKSMQHNNTSCFCHRNVDGSRSPSRHALGMAVDINPLYNPCVRTLPGGRVKIQPKTAAPYADRSRRFDYKIVRGDLCHRLFTEHGFTWGGSWRSLKDYQHFERAQ